MEIVHFPSFTGTNMKNQKNMFSSTSIGRVLGFFYVGPQKF